MTKAEYQNSPFRTRLDCLEFPPGTVYVTSDGEAGYAYRSHLWSYTFVNKIYGAKDTLVVKIVPFWYRWVNSSNCRLIKDKTTLAGIKKGIHPSLQNNGQGVLW